MAKKLQGAAIDHNGWIEFDQAPDEPGPWQKATLVIGDERVFTESEVRAMLKDILDAQERLPVNDGSGGQDIVWAVGTGEVEAVFSRVGISIDPA